MTTCSIIIYNYESLVYLRACVRQIRRYANPAVSQHIYIGDQSVGADSRQAVKDEFGNSPDITIVNCKNLFSGYTVDYILRYHTPTTEYLACMDVDAFPIQRNWLSMPIALLEENNLAFVGGLAFENETLAHIYPPVKFFSMSPFFCVGRTKDWIEMALEGGFTRYHERPKVERGMTWNNYDWVEWAMGDNYWERGSDDCVPAWCWLDQYRESNKLSLAVTDIIGEPGKEAGYGRILDDIVFHFGFCFTALTLDKEMGKKYVGWKQRIHDDFSDALIDEMLSAARTGENNTTDRFRTRSLWDGKTKMASALPDELHKRIEELKQQ